MNRGVAERGAVESQVRQDRRGIGRRGIGIRGGTELGQIDCTVVAADDVERDTVEAHVLQVRLAEQGRPEAEIGGRFPDRQQGRAIRLRDHNALKRCAQAERIDAHGLDRDRSREQATEFLGGAGTQDSGQAKEAEEHHGAGEGEAREGEKAGPTPSRAAAQFSKRPFHLTVLPHWTAAARPARRFSLRPALSDSP